MADKSKQQQRPADLPAKSKKLSPDEVAKVKGGMVRGGITSLTPETCKETGDSGMMGCGTG